MTDTLTALVTELRQQAKNRTEQFGEGANEATVEWRAANELVRRGAQSQSGEDKPRDSEINDQDEILLAYGLLWCMHTTDTRVHSARRELLIC